MKLLYILILFIFSSSIMCYAQKVKGRRGNDRHKLRRHTNGFSLIPQNGKQPVGEKQIPELLENREGFKTLQEARDKLNKGGRKKRQPLKTNQVISFIKKQIEPFAVSELWDHFPDFSNRTLRVALKESAANGEIVLIQKGDRDGRPSVWIRATILKKKAWTSEEALDRYYKISGLSVISKTQQIHLLVKSLGSAFSVSEIQEQFPDISLSVIYRVLKELTSLGELILLKPFASKFKVWIRSDIFHKEGQTTEQVLKRYRESSGLSVSSPTEEIRLFIQDLRSSFTASYIQDHFPDFLNQSIRIVLKRLADTGELHLLQQGDGKFNPNIWIRAVVLHEEGLTPEQALKRHHKSSNLFAKSQMGQVEQFVKNLTSAFTISEIQKHFPDFPMDQVHEALEKLMVQGKIRLISRGLGPRRWMRSDLLAEQNVTKESGNLKKSAETKDTKEKQIMSFIGHWMSPFDVLDIQEHFPGFTAKQIRQALEVLETQEKISPVRQNKQLKWVRADLLPEKGKTWEEASESRVKSWLLTHTNTIMPFIEGREAFTISDIQNNFPGLSYTAIESVLNQLASETKLTLLRPGENGSSMWISTAVLHNKGLTPEKALVRYHGRSEKDFKSDYPTALNGENLKTQIKPLNGNNLAMNKKTANILFRLADSFKGGFLLSEETKSAFLEVINIHVDLAYAFFDLIEEIREGYVSFLPEDALSIVSHTSRLKERLFQGQVLDLSKIEDAANRIIELIDIISLKGGRSSPDEPLNHVSKELNSLFSDLQAEEAIVR